MNCTKLPNTMFDDIQLTTNKIQVDIDNLPERLNQFRKKYCPDNEDISINYTTQPVIVIISKKRHAWSEDLHNFLCHEFKVILNSAEKVQSFEPAGDKMSIYYLYIPRFYREKYNKENSISFVELPII